MLVVAALMGTLTALLVGLTSTGGGSLLTPALVLGLGLPPSVAVGVDLISVSAMKSVSVALYAKRRDVDWRMAGWLALGSLPALCAALAVSSAIPPIYRETVIRRGLGVALLATAIATLVRSFQRPPAEPTRPPRRWIAVVIGAGVGFLTSLTSVGAGSLLILYLSAHYPTATRRVVGTDLAHAVGLTAVGALGHGLMGHINWPVAMAVTAGALPGAFLGAGLAGRIPDAWVRRSIALTLGATSVALLGA
jgi:uncharacterized membrane protein YfcA